MTTNQKLECSKEVRLWLGKIFTAIIIWESFPQLRYTVQKAIGGIKFKINNLITGIKNKFKRG